MSKLQVLVTTMYATDFSKYYEMNLKTDSVIANQADENSTLNKTINGNSVKLVTTSTRGTSKNRNIALLNINPNAQYIMFSDVLLYPEGSFDLIFHLALMVPV